MSDFISGCDIDEQMIDVEAAKEERAEQLYWSKQRYEDMKFWMETRQPVIHTTVTPWSHHLARVECPRCQAENTLGRVIDVVTWFASDEEYGWRVTNERTKYIKCWGCRKSLSAETCAGI